MPIIYFRMEEVKNSKEKANTGEDDGPNLAATHRAGPNLKAESSVPAPITQEDSGARSVRYFTRLSSYASSLECHSITSRRSKFCRSASGLLSLQEFLKEKQV